MFWTTPRSDWSGMMSRQASTEPKQQVEVGEDDLVCRGLGQGRREVDGQRRAADAPGRPCDRDDLGPSRDVRPARRSALRSSRRMTSSSSVGSVGSVRNSRAPARMTRRIIALSRIRLAGRTTTSGDCWTIVWISWMACSGSAVEGDDDQVGADLGDPAWPLPHRRRRPRRARPRRSRRAAAGAPARVSSWGSTRTTRIASFMASSSNRASRRWGWAGSIVSKEDRADRGSSRWGSE